MELSREISIEHLPGSHHNSLTSLLSDPQLQTVELDLDVTVTQGSDEIVDKVEALLLSRIKEGNEIALFQLGQLYFEQVSVVT